MASLKLSSVRIAALLVLGLTLAACSGGEDGKDGAAGPAGPPGSSGPTGPSGGGGVPVDSAERVNIVVGSVAVPGGGGAPTVELTLTNELDQGLTGLTAGSIRFVLSQLSPGTDGGSSEWQNYFTTDDNGIPDIQGTAEPATDGTFVDNGDGSYQYTFAKDLTAYPAGPIFDATKTHRLGVEIRGLDATLTSNGIYDFVPAGGAPLVERRIVDNDTCNACHDRLEFHGGPRTDVEYCVTCHNPSSFDGNTGNPIDMKALVHNIHAGRLDYVIVGHGDRVHDFSEVRWTQNLRNCQTCHEESDLNTPQASNWRQVPNRAACGTCHYNDGIPGTVNDYAIEDGEHPLGLQFDNDTQCLGCHGPDSAIEAVRVANAHVIPTDEAAKAFEYRVVGVADTNPGDTPTVSIQVLNPTDPNYDVDPASTAYDINDPAGPFQTSSARLRVDIAWTDDDIGNLDPNDDLGRSPDSGAPFAPIDIDFKTGATTLDNITFTKTASSAIPTGVTGSGFAILEGRPQVLIGGVLSNIPVAANGMAFGITDTMPRDRRKVVDIGKCNDCHKNLSLHGDNRSGNTAVCSTCHNPNATDIQRRVPGSTCEAELGLDDEPIDLKRMVHMIHSGNIGLCGYNNTAHPYFDVAYPGHLNNCEGCHLPGMYYPVDPDVVLATTVDAGPDRSTLLDDVAISPNTSICSGCHTSGLAAQHMIQNGGDFDAGKDDTGALIADGVETCGLCHGPGRTADVAEMHDVAGFVYN